MLQTLNSISKDEPKFAGTPKACRASLFVEVTDWSDTLKRLQGYEIAMPERETFNGMREIRVFEPNGHVVVFAARQ